LCSVAKPSGNRDVAEFQLRDGIEHDGMQHPRRGFDIADLIVQSRIIALDDRVTPLDENGDYRLSRVQLRLDHVTTIAPTTDSLGVHRGLPT
jgi:hypothetical protein